MTPNERAGKLKKHRGKENESPGAVELAQLSRNLFNRSQNRSENRDLTPNEEAGKLKKHQNGTKNKSSGCACSLRTQQRADCQCQYVLPPFSWLW
ncbi:hypothetical protein MXD59_23975, partial [Frankia sp. Ag45/Mut15]